MKHMVYQQEVDLLVESKDILFASDFFDVMKGCSEQTVYSRIRHYLKLGVLEVVGRGKYRKTFGFNRKIDFNSLMIKANDFMYASFPGLPFCLSQLNDLVILEVQKQSLDEVCNALNNNHFNAALHSRAAGVLSLLHDCVLVRSLISDSPIEIIDSVRVPTIEKTLVDAISDSSDYHYVHKRFQLAYENHPINDNRLMRYAGRRCLKEEVMRHLEDVNQERIGMFSSIRKYLSTIPVERAWLFGSYSRCEETQDSDVDLLIEFSNNSAVSLLDMSGYKIDLESILHKKVDLIENGQLRPFAQPSANRDKVLIYVK